MQNTGAKQGLMTLEARLYHRACHVPANVHGIRSDYVLIYVLQLFAGLKSAKNCEIQHLNKVHQLASRNQLVELFKIAMASVVHISNRACRLTKLQKRLFWLSPNFSCGCSLSVCLHSFQ